MINIEEKANKMTWEKCIAYFQGHPDYKKVLYDSYLESDIIRNAERFAKSDEFEATKQIINENTNGLLKIADVGAGNGIASFAFAALGHKVYAIEPYQSDLVGYGAINKLKEAAKLDLLEVLPQSMEENSLKDESIDVVYCRQVLHHANDLKIFAKEVNRVLANNGLLVATREHVITNKKDKKAFLLMHPFHKYTLNENAFTLSEYMNAFTSEGFEIIKVLKYFDSQINYYPLTSLDVKSINEKLRNDILEKYRRKVKINFLAFSLCQLNLFWLFLKKYYPVEEKSFPGRMNTFIMRKV